MNNYFSQKVTTFHDRKLPEEAMLVGYALLIQVLEHKANQYVPIPPQLSIVTEKHQRYNTEQWQVFTQRHKPKEDLASHLSFALKHEAIDLYILKSFFQYVGGDLIKSMIIKEPTGQYSRKAWFLYEWLINVKLDVGDLKKGTYVDLVNPKFQYPGSSRNSTRHRVKNNLPGTSGFCPMIRRTEKIEEYRVRDLSVAIEKGLSEKDKGLIRRAAAFLLLKDSKASFAIEGEYPPNHRAIKWGKAIGQAGKNALTIHEIERLQDIVIGAKKLKHMGIRKQEGFIGEHDRETFSPIPDHISAKSENLPDLLQGLIDTNNLLQTGSFDPVLAATIIAFGFVFIHPLADGNGRIHRYLIHHTLVKLGFTKRELIFPISASILDHISDYQDVLESFSSPRLDLIRWNPTPDHNIEILNETIDLYRYYDITAQVEFLYFCIQDTIERIIPEELDYLEKHDKMIQVINDLVTLPDTKADLLIKFLNQNNGKLSREKRQKEFDELTNKEIADIEENYLEIFSDFKTNA